MRVCPKCGRRYLTGDFCKSCGSRLKGSGASLLLIAAGIIVLLMMLFAAFALGITILLGSGVLRSPTNLSVSAQSQLSCGSSLAYSVQLSDQQGRPLSGAQVSAYGNGALLESLLTDQNGRFSSSIQIPSSWC